MGKIIRFDDAARRSLRRGAEQLAGAVRVTLGPRGRNVVLDRNTGLPTITNDGLTIANEIELADPFENMGVQLVKEAATRTGEMAGDGTTTATVLAHGIIVRGLGAVAAGHNPMAVKRGIERATEAVVRSLRQQSREMDSRADLERVATVSARNDAAIGAMVAEAFERVGRHGVVTAMEGRGLDTTLEVVEGVRFDHGYLSPYFVTEPETMTVALENALVLLCDLKLTTARELLPALEHAAEARRPLLVIAEDVEGEALATLVVNRLRGTVGSAATRATAVGERRRELLEDLATLTGARLFAADLGRTIDVFRAEDLGRVRRVTMERDATTLLECGGDPTAIRERMEQLRRAADAEDDETERDRLRERLAWFSGGAAVIHVGAPTEIEMNARKARIEDALAATRSAIEEGVVVGGGVALIRAQSSLEGLDLAGGEAAGVELVRAMLEVPAFQIAANAGADGGVVVAKIRDGTGPFGYDARSGRFGDLEALGILDPTKVPRCALQHATSIGVMVLTTDAIVVDDPKGGSAESGE